MLLTALLFNTLTGVVCASVLGFSPVAGAVGMNAVAAFMGMAPQSTSILREGYKPLHGVLKYFAGPFP